jgi:hypothetical protein
MSALFYRAYRPEPARSTSVKASHTQRTRGSSRVSRWPWGRDGLARASGGGGGGGGLGRLSRARGRTLAGLLPLKPGR